MNEERGIHEEEEKEAVDTIENLIKLKSITRFTPILRSHQLDIKKIK